MSEARNIPVSRVDWPDARRIIRSQHPPIDLFEDIAEPSDWSRILSGEQKTNPRLMENIGQLDLVPEERRVGGPGASYLMAPFTHCSTDRPSRYSEGRFGVLYVGETFEVTLFETLHHHTAFMARTQEAAGWTSSFRELLLDVSADLHDLRPGAQDHAAILDPDDYGASQRLGQALRAAGSDGLVYPSVRCPRGDCAGLFHPDLASNPRQGRHLDYHWNGRRVDFVRESDSGRVFAIT
ncbi:RES family NAD+ phosphorylase [Fodinicurvata halophila]|uniref:RES family NAD+ phosphorylase n=1 Tax=Fodinicurvata halophila TaxID=1419723 RepID=A0ABV8UHU8_9PROT